MAAGEWAEVTADKLWNLAASGERYRYSVAYIDETARPNASHELIVKLLQRTENGYGYHIGPVRIALTRVLPGLGTDHAIAVCWAFLALTDLAARQALLNHGGEYGYTRLISGLYHFIHHLADTPPKP